MSGDKFWLLKYRRTAYAKKIRKDYEAGRIKERRSNLRERAAVRAVCANTLTTVDKDNTVVVKRKKSDKGKT